MSHIDDGTLHAYLDGECSERRRAEVERHLSDCEECRGRLQDARTAGRRASELLAQLEPDPLHAPSWREIEERSAARERTPTRRSWLRPGLGWAATIAIAFGLGWLSSSYWTRTPGPALDVATRPATQKPARSRKLEPAEPPAAAASERAGGAPARSAASDLAEAPAAPAAPAAPIARADAPLQVTGALEARELAAKKRARFADEARAADEADRPSMQARGLVERKIDTAAGRASRLARSGRFYSVPPQEAAAWLGAELRTLPDLRLTRVEVGPGSAVAGGLAGLPAIRLVYEDAAGHEIALIEQLAGASADADDAEPTLIVTPSGSRAYRWHDGQGYWLTLSGSVSSDSLRALADRVR